MLRLIRENPNRLKAKDLATLCGVSERGVYRYLNSLAATGTRIRMGSNGYELLNDPFRSGTEANMPVLHVSGSIVPEVWERAVVQTWEYGYRIPTEYDKEGDPPSRDCVMVMEVYDPMGEPRAHRAFPGEPKTLEEYVEEIIGGGHDHLVGPDGLSYTYHDRITRYPTEPGKRSKQVNQLQYILDKLAETPYSRRAQAITWIPGTDAWSVDPPCLQRIWCRVAEVDGEMFLNMNTHWRSRDAWRAAFMNMYGLTALQQWMASLLGVRVGKYVDISDSFHIYGSCYKEFEGFLRTLDSRTFEERTWTTEELREYL